jgi:HK97 family phage prohead protease
MDYKSTIAKIGDIEVKGQTVAGYFAAFNTLDYDEDVIEPGAFEKTISERGPEGTNQIFHLFQHDPWKVLGKPNVLKEDNYGLYFETPIVDTQLGIDAVKLYAAKVYNEHSIGYRVMAWAEEERNGVTVRVLKELKLWEGSTVTWGANENTPFVGFKTLDKSEKINQIGIRIERIQKVMKDEKLSADTIAQLKISLEQMADLNKSLDQTNGPDDHPPRNLTGPSEEDVKRLVNESVNKYFD